MSTRNLLVPHDFTAAGDSAVEYAINFAKEFNAEIHMLHVTKDIKDNRKAKAKFEEIMEKLNCMINIEEIELNLRLYMLLSNNIIC